MKSLKLAIFASGRGSNFQAIYQAIEEGKLNARIQVVISNNADAGALDFAREHQIPALHLSRNQFTNASMFDLELLRVLREHDVNFIALAGYMKLIRPQIIREFHNRILNIHPALLPSFGGKGMYGHFVHEAVREYGCKVTGVTVHLVDEEYDHGPIVVQKTVPVYSEDTPEMIANRVLEMEHVAYAEALQLFAEERVQIQGRRTLIRL
ncbi:phosphoribosylglycinamide formyltransferase [candidate division KSB1 bacterium]|nr:phosphoribosylglycinamide formyltransferase [candidate division KSB1 bacterium]